MVRFQMAQHRTMPLSQDAALVAALAGTAMPFSHSSADQAERWLRVLRLHGQVGCALQALGVGEAPLMTGSDPAPPEPTGLPASEDVVDEVVYIARDFAVRRGGGSVSTADLLFALLAVYDRLMDRALYTRGTSREELLERLATVGDTAEAAG